MCVPARAASGLIGRAPPASVPGAGGPVAARTGADQPTVLSMLLIASFQAFAELV